MYLEAADASAIEKIRFLLNIERNEEVIALCLRYLGRFGNASDLELIGRFLEHHHKPRPNFANEEDRDTAVRLEGMLALGRIGNRKALPSLRNLDPETPEEKSVYFLVMVTLSKRLNISNDLTAESYGLQLYPQYVDYEGVDLKGMPK